jgi:hypothetical protein
MDGGKNRKMLYNTTARFRLSPEALAREPVTGGLLARRGRRRRPAGAAVRVRSGSRGCALFRFVAEADLPLTCTGMIQKSRQVDFPKAGAGGV